MGRIILLGILAYIAYRIYRFFAPVFRVFKRANEEFKNARQQSNPNMNSKEKSRFTDSQQTKDNQVDGEYIDYEEVK